MTVARSALLRRYFAVAPVDVLALVQAFRSASRVTVFQNDSAAGNIVAIHNDKPACGNDLALGIKADGALGADIQLRHLVPANEGVVSVALQRLQCGGINYFLDLIDLA